MTSDRVILFTRYPVPGVAKTRLVPVLGERGAAELARRMVRHTLLQVRGVLGDGVALEVRHAGGDGTEMAAWLGEGLHCRPQGGGDLGERMERALREAFAESCGRAVIVGADCPGLDASVVRAAFEALEGRALVLGPAEDGGYYLVGARRETPSPALAALFRDIPWGGSEVLARTLDEAAAHGMVPALLPVLPDVDRPEDLPAWESAAFRSGAALLSVVVPVLDEAALLPDLLRSLAAEDGVEVVVADGGSEDGTAEACAHAGVRLVRSPPGRAVQLAAGAAEAVGDGVLFLHADTRLPRGFPPLVRRVLRDSNAAGGAFSLAIEGGGAFLRAVEAAANWRARALGVVFGDQAIFARASVLRRVGGVPQLPLMEDWELVRTLRRAGKFTILPHRAVTSAPRWQEGGALRVTLANQAATWLYAAGGSATAAARLHRVLAGPPRGGRR